MPTHDRPAGPYRIIIFDAIDDPAPVRDLICRATGLHPADANRWLARVPGISEQALDEAQARALLDGLYELGVAAEARRAEALPQLGPGHAVHAVACRPEGFRVDGLRGEPAHWVPWSTIELVDGGLVEQPPDERAVAAPPLLSALRRALGILRFRPRSIAPRAGRTLQFERPPVAEAVLVRRDPTRAFRLVATELNYAYLGDRLRPSAAENFRLLLRDLYALADAAEFTASARALFDGDESAPDLATFSAPAALLDHARLALLRLWYRRDRADAGAGTDPGSP